MAYYGGFWRRVAAYIIDSIILNIAFSFLAMIFGIGLSVTSLIGDGAMGDTLAFGTITLIWTVNIVGNWLYFALMESSSMQATIGKLALGVVVTDEHGDRISFLRATGRYFAKILSGLILLIGFIMVAFTARKQGLHDFIASTLVHKTRDPGSLRSHASVFE
jgi:uncharacterized RDD family membrane protein YckC